MGWHKLPTSGTSLELKVSPEKLSHGILPAWSAGHFETEQRVMVHPSDPARRRGYTEPVIELYLQAFPQSGIFVEELLAGLRVAESYG
jgi:hypothetical protein